MIEWSIITFESKEIMDIKQVFTTPDGKQFDNRADAVNYIRRPKIEAALKVVTENNAKLTTWLIDNQEQVEVAFEVGTIRRVTKVEGNKLQKALDALLEIQGNPKIAFLQENASAIKDSFRWPSVKRMSDEEKTTAARNSLVAATEGDESLAAWIISKKDAILEAYEAGKEKREINPKATEALAAYRAKKAAEKEAAEKAAAAAKPAEGSTAPAAS